MLKAKHKTHVTEMSLFMIMDYELLRPATLYPSAAATETAAADWPRRMSCSESFENSLQQQQQQQQRINQINQSFVNWCHKDNILPH